MAWNWPGNLQDPPVSLRKRRDEGKGDITRRLILSEGKPVVVAPGAGVANLEH